MSGEVEVTSPVADLPVVSFDGPHATASGIPADAEVPGANDLASNAREEVVARRPESLWQRVDEPRWECHFLMMPAPPIGTYMTCWDGTSGRRALHFLHSCCDGL